MNQQWQKLQDKIDAMNQRERIILLVTVLVAIVMLFQVVLIDPVMESRKRSKLEIYKLQEAIQRDQNALLIVNAQLQAGVNRDKENMKQRLAEEVGNLDKKIEDSVVALIPPQRMPELLESVLSENRELRLVSLENKPVAPVLEEGDEEDAAAQKGGRGKKADEKSAQKQGLYKHGFVLTLSGNYMAAIRYFEELSKLPWRFYWDDLRYEVESYPNATITLEVHTVSLSEDWIGV